jgi:hypothetical protein
LDVILLLALFKMLAARIWLENRVAVDAGMNAATASRDVGVQTSGVVQAEKQAGILTSEEGF